MNNDLIFLYVNLPAHSHQILSFYQPATHTEEANLLFKTEFYINFNLANFHYVIYLMKYRNQIHLIYITQNPT